MAMKKQFSDVGKMLGDEVSARVRGGWLVDTTIGAVDEVRGYVKGEESAGADEAEILTEQPIYEIVCKFAGTINTGANSRVRLYQDRVEYDGGRAVSGAKVAAGVMTAGISLAATGFRQNRGNTEMIPLDAITSVTTRRESLRFQIVSIITAGNTIDFRVPSSQAVEMQKAILNARAAALQGRNTVQAAIQPQVIHQAVPSLSDQIQELSKLRLAGVLTDEEYERAKAKALGI